VLEREALAIKLLGAPGEFTASLLVRKQALSLHNHWLGLIAVDQRDCAGFVPDRFGVLTSVADDRQTYAERRHRGTSASTDPIGVWLHNQIARSQMLCDGTGGKVLDALHAL
jgi:hypothetical protein